MNITERARYLVANNATTLGGAFYPYFRLPLSLDMKLNL